MADRTYTDFSYFYYALLGYIVNTYDIHYAEFQSVQNGDEYEQSYPNNRHLGGFLVE